MRYIFYSLLFLLTFSETGYGQDTACNCPKILSYISDKLKSSYSGYSTKINRGNRQKYFSLLKKLNKAAAVTSDIDSCFLLTSSLTGFFSDLHVRTQFEWRYAEKYPERMQHIRKKLDKDSGPVSTVSIKTGLRPLGDRSFLLTLASFERDHKPIIDSLLAKYSADLRRTENLIIDIRNNDGGYDFVFSEILPYIYSKPYVYYYNEILASAEAIKLYRENHNNPSHSAELRGFFGRAVEIMEKHSGKFVTLSGKRTDTIRMDTVMPYPRRIAIIMDRGTMSAAENFVQIAQQSEKVTLFGSNTAGAVDYTEVLWLKVPDFPALELIIPIQRSTRLPEHPLDNFGIAPDVRIPESADSYTFVLEWLNRPK